MKSVKLVIADDHPIIRSAIKASIQRKPEWQVVGEAGNGFELLDLLKAVKPDVAIIDLEMPLLKGYETIAEISASYPEIKTIALSGFLNATNRQRAIDAGASATVSKSVSMDDVQKTIESVTKGENSHQDDSPFIDEMPAVEQGDALLTLRERQILKLIAHGKTSRNISDICYISRWTVDKHRANIKAKLGLKNVAELVRYAIDNGYINHEDE